MFHGNKLAEESSMRYLILGPGGIGGSIGGFLSAAGHDVSFIAHGRTLDALRKEGLKVNSSLKGQIHIRNVKVFSPEEFIGQADVIFVCVKDYSLDSVLPVLGRACGSSSVIIPLLNGFGAGDRIREKLPGCIVTDGCIYISAFIDSPGCVTQVGSLFRMFFGFKKNSDFDNSILEVVTSDLGGAGIDAAVSGEIETEVFRKFSFVSTAAACGAYYGITMGGMQRPGRCRDTFLGLCAEMCEIAGRLGFGIRQDLVDINLGILDQLSPETSSSLQKDLESGRQSEIDSLVFSVVRLADRLGVETPLYRMVAEKLKN
jgi:2-dehydropantoate 2-reductase